MAGDFNEAKCNQIEIEYKNLNQIVNVPTRGTKTLDLIYTDIENYEIETMDGLEHNLADGCRSDHRIVVAKFSKIKQQNKYFTIKKRTFPESNMINFGNIISNTNWSFLQETAHGSNVGVLLKVRDDLFMMRDGVLDTSGGGVFGS